MKPCGTASHATARGKARSGTVARAAGNVSGMADDHAVKNSRGEPSATIVTLTDITQRNGREDEIRHLAFDPATTRLPNRRLLLDRLHQALASSARSEPGCAVVPRSRQVQGPQRQPWSRRRRSLLQHVAQRLTTCIREGDTVARLGGDEFVLMLVDLVCCSMKPRRRPKRSARRSSRPAQPALRPRRPHASKQRQHRRHIVLQPSSRHRSNCSSRPTSPCTRPRRPAATRSASIRGNAAAAGRPRQGIDLTGHWLSGVD